MCGIHYKPKQGSSNLSNLAVPSTVTENTTSMGLKTNHTQALRVGFRFQKYTLKDLGGKYHGSDFGSVSKDL